MMLQSPYICVFSVFSGPIEGLPVIRYYLSSVMTKITFGADANDCLLDDTSGINTHDRIPIAVTPKLAALGNFRRVQRVLSTVSCPTDSDFNPTSLPTLPYLMSSVTGSPRFNPRTPRPARCP